MAIFKISESRVESVKLSEFKLEKDLQNIIEANLQTIFNCRLIASEYSTGAVHAGRIDSLALSEDNNPVIIEYKKVASSELINQSLYYLHWIIDHKGDFQIAANQVLGSEISIDWSDIRVICIAPEYKKYDLHAVKVMGANIELWQYRLYENGILSLEEIFRRSEGVSPNDTLEISAKNPKMVEAGKKAALTRKTAIYDIEDHLNSLDGNLKQLFCDIREYILSLDESIEETPKKEYIAYKTSQNFVCLETQKRKMLLFLKVKPDEVKPWLEQCRDVRNIGHYGTGDLEVSIMNVDDFERTKYLIDLSLKNIGG